ncbi:MAG: hypothetical protein QOD57_148, partial [Actinomycetota bacterium]|nr:hypothetical protein [Actinomycetota bacterium]
MKLLRRSLPSVAVLLALGAMSLAPLRSSAEPAP